MSEPVTQAEIEDVLSSIRRLVSEDVRDGRGETVAEDPVAEPVPSAEPVEAASNAKATTRLVLTPALRVSDAKTPTEPAAAVEPGDSVAAPLPTEEGAGACLQEVGSAETGADVDAAPEAESEPETDAPWKDPWATLYQAAGVSGATDQAVEAGEATETFQEPADRVSAVVQKITELEVKVARSQEQWEPDGRTADPFAGSNIETLQWQDHCEEEEAEAVDAASAGPQEDLQSEVQFHHHDAQYHEPQHADPVDSAPQGHEDLLEAALDGAEEAVTSQTLETLAGEDAFIDEESLRELVADIVREELQGALGERITRNVRKLVRREIHRALAAKDLL